MISHVEDCHHWKRIRAFTNLTFSKEAFNVFREATRLIKARKGARVQSFTLIRYSVNGKLLERWFLKTLINLAWDGSLIIGPGDHETGTPSTDLVEIAFD